MSGGWAGCMVGRAGGVLLAVVICAPVGAGGGQTRGRPSPSSGRRRSKAGAAAGRGRWAKEKARAGGAVCALLLWLCFSADVVVPGCGCCPGAVVVLIGGEAGALIPGAQFRPAQFQPEPFQGGKMPPGEGVRFFTLRYYAPQVSLQQG